MTSSNRQTNKHSNYLQGYLTEIAFNNATTYLIQFFKLYNLCKDIFYDMFSVPVILRQVGGHSQDITTFSHIVLQIIISTLEYEKYLM